MQESCTYGSVRGAPGNGRPYRDIWPDLDHLLISAFLGQNGRKKRSAYIPRSGRIAAPQRNDAMGTEPAINPFRSTGRPR